MPTEPKVTKYEVGTPTSINIENPTVLQPSGIKVDNYANIDSLVLKNIPNTKTYKAFEEMFQTYMFGGSIIFNKTINNQGNIVDSNVT